MRSKKLALLAGLAATVAGVAVIGVPGIASADGKGVFCDNGANCMSMNGTKGDRVYGKEYQKDQQETTNVLGYGGCLHAGAASIYVQAVGFHGDTTNCPFTVKALDQLYKGDEIVKIYNYNGAEYVTDVGGILRQEPPGSGQEFIQTTYGGYVNVLASDANSTEADPESWAMCGTGLNNPVTISASNACTWFFR